MAGGSAGGSSSAAPFVGDLCVRGWCVERPLGGLTNWRGQFFLSPTLGFMVSDAGHLMQWDGQSWRQVREGDGVRLRGVWAASATDVWAVGAAGQVVRFNGTTATAQRLTGNPELRSVWGSGPNDVWIVGDNGTIAHWDGANLTLNSSPTTNSLMELWGSSADNVLAVGLNGTIIRFNGFGWGLVTPPAGNSGQAFYAVDGVGPTDFVVAGVKAFRSAAFADGGLNTAGWVELPNVPNSFTMYALDALPGGGVWAGSSDGRVAFWDGTTWSVTTVPPSGSIYGINALGADVYAYGISGTALRRRGTTWAELVPRDRRDLVRLVSNQDGSEVFGVGRDGLVLRRGATGDWQPVATGFGGVNFGHGCFNGSTGVALDADGGVYRLTSSSVVPLALAAPASTTYLACAAGGDFYAANPAMTYSYFPTAGASVTGAFAGTMQGLIEVGPAVWGLAYASGGKAAKLDGGASGQVFTFGADVDLGAPRSADEFLAVDLGTSSSSLYLVRADGGVLLGSSPKVSGSWAATTNAVLNLQATATDFTYWIRLDSDAGVEGATVTEDHPGMGEAKVMCRNRRCFISGQGGFIFRRDL